MPVDPANDLALLLVREFAANVDGDKVRSLLGDVVVERLSLGVSDFGHAEVRWWGWIGESEETSGVRSFIGC
mgnify:CR=1 FL=1